MSATAVVSVPGDAELGNWLVCPKVRWPADQAYIIAARNDAPEIAKALVEAVDLIRTTEKHINDTPWSMRGDNMLADIRAFLAQHGEE